MPAILGLLGAAAASVDSHLRDDGILWLPATMHRALLMGDDRKLRAHWRAAYWQVRDMAWEAFVRWEMLYLDIQWPLSGVVWSWEKLRSWLDWD